MARRLFTQAAQEAEQALAQVSREKQVTLGVIAMPDSVFIQGILDASLLVPITKAVALRFYYRYENGRISDWHYDGVQQNPVPSPLGVYLDYGPQSYQASIAGVFIRYAF